MDECERFIDVFAPTVGLALEPFQHRIVEAAFGSARELLVLIPRGNGKSSLIAALALFHLLTVEDAQVYCAATSVDRAKVVFEYAQGFARRFPSAQLIDRHLELRVCPDPRKPRVILRHLRVVPADAP